MPSPARAGGLIYVLDVARMSVFYQRVLGMKVLHARADHHVIQSPDIQLILHAIPPHIAETIMLSSPPELREESAIKLFFTVSSFSEAEEAMKSLGGALHDDEWTGPGFKIRNAHDPEGNIFQIRELVD